MNSFNTKPTAGWQKALTQAITDPKELLELLELDPHLLNEAYLAAKSFPLKVPRGFVARMQKNNLFDPLLQQILPIGAELDEVTGFSRDPLQEKNVNPLSGLLHKYHGRVLLTLTGACGIHCRYCFRRDFPYEKNNPGTAGWNQALDYIAKDQTITEVILSGGDPLVVSDTALNNFTQQLAVIPHLKRLRLHSRMPIVVPERITPEFIHSITPPALKTILVVHCNHPQEINEDVIQAMHLLTGSGIVLFNQTVLLKGINDNVETLIALSETLFAGGIQPYYLHVLDKIQGAAHFDLSRARALQLHQGMKERLSGYLVPQLVCEQPGAPSKISLENREFYTG
ncbi:MAG TPA: EF-P beta-lysylation protein EpmB [Gammaproteobacteria bacterium]|nr:EF-P beta-lysylation protein EpmB [Gammaproteobacteria bacterium]